MKSHLSIRPARRASRFLAPAVGAFAFSWMLPSLAEEEIKNLGYDILANTSGGSLVQGVVFDLEVTAENPVTIDQILFQIRGNNASTWDFTVRFREGSLADEIELIDEEEMIVLPAHRVESEWVIVGEALAVPSPPSNGKHPITLNMGPAEDGGLELTEGRYSFYFSSVGLEGSASNNGLRTVNPASPLPGNPPFYQPLDAILENADMQVLLGGSKGSLFGTTNPFSNLRAFGEFEIIYSGGDDLDPPPPLPTPVDLTVDSVDFTYTQDFNSLGDFTLTWINSGTLPGWHIYILDDASFTMDNRDLPATGGIQRRTYLNFGFTEEERALGATAGSVYSGISEITNIPVDETFGFITLAMVNETTEVIDSLALSYDGLQFELGNSSGPQELRVGHATSAATVPTDPADWTEVPDVNFFSPQLSTDENPQPTGLINPFSPENRANRVAGDLTGLDWQPGDTLWIRWLDTNAPGGDHGVLIDNVSLNLTQSLRWDGGNWAATGNGGSGIWDNETGGWLTDRVAVFDGVDGAVNVGNVTAASGLRFLKGDFQLENGTLNLAGTIDSQNQIFVGEDAGADIQTNLDAPNGFTKTGEGSLFLGGNNAISGRSAIHAGTVFAGAGSLGGDLDVRGLLDLTDDDDFAFEGLLSGSGAIRKAGDGTLTLTNASAFLGVFDIEEGTLSGPAAGLPGGTILNESELVIDEPGTGTLDALIDGPGMMVKSGPGTARLTRGNPYSGGNMILEGTLLIDGDQSAAFEMPTTVAENAALGGVGTVGGEVVAAPGSRIVPGGEGAIGTFTMFDGGVISGSFEMEFNANASDRVRVFLGTLDISNATLDLRLAAGATPEAVVYPLLEIDANASLVGEFAQVLGMPAGYMLDYDLNSGFVSLVQDITVGGGFAEWIAGFTTVAPELAGPLADADGSGTANLLEFILNGNPTDPSLNGLQAAWISEIAPENPLRFTIAAPRGTTFEATPGGPQVAVVDGFTVQVEGSGNLAAFDLDVVHLATADDVPESGLPSLASEDWEYHTFGITGSSGKAFMRVSAAE